MAIPTVGAIIMTMTQTMTHTMSTTQYDYDHEESPICPKVLAKTPWLGSGALTFKFSTV